MILRSLACWLVTLAWTAPVLEAQDCGEEPPDNFPTRSWGDMNGSVTSFSVRTPLLEVFAAFEHGERQFQVVHRDRLGEHGYWSAKRASQEVSYFLTDCGFSAGGTKLYLTGVLPGGETIIEEWQVAARPTWGRVRVTPTPPSLPIGQPQPSKERSLSLPEAYSSAEEVTLERTRVVYQGGRGPFKQLAVDTEERYLILLSAAGDLLQLPLNHPTQESPESEFTTVLTRADLPELEYMRSMEVILTKDGGRAVRMSNHAGCIIFEAHKFFFVHDVENDGVFESWDSVGMGEYLKNPTEGHESPTRTYCLRE